MFSNVYFMPTSFPCRMSRICSEIEWLTSLRPLTWDKVGRAVETRCIRGYNRDAFLRGEQVPLQAALVRRVQHVDAACVGGVRVKNGS